MRSSVVFALVLIGVFAGPMLVSAATAGMLDVDVKDVPVKQAIDTLFEGRGLKYYIQPGVKGRIVELRLKGIGFEEGLQALGDAAGFSFRVEEGAYIISPGNAAKTAHYTAPPVSAPAAMGTGGQGAPPVNQPPPPAAPQVVVNNNITSPPPVYADAPAASPAPFYGVGANTFGGGWGPTFNLGAGPYVFGRFTQPPPPRGWVTPDVERFLRFEWAVPTRPGYAAPYPYYYP